MKPKERERERNTHTRRIQPEDKSGWGMGSSSRVSMYVYACLCVCRCVSMRMCMCVHICAFGSLPNVFPLMNHVHAHQVSAADAVTSAPRALAGAKVRRSLRCDCSERLPEVVPGQKLYPGRNVPGHKIVPLVWSWCTICVSEHVRWTLFRLLWNAHWTKYL